MGREIKDKKFPLNFSAADSERRIKCPRAAPARFRSSPPCGEPSRRALLTGRCRGNFSSGIVAPFRREKTRRRIQDRHAEARCARKVARDRDAPPAILAPIRSRGKMSASGRSFNPRQDARAEGKHLEQRRVRSDMKETVWIEFLFSLLAAWHLRLRVMGKVPLQPRRGPRFSLVDVFGASSQHSTKHRA